MVTMLAELDGLRELIRTRLCEPVDAEERRAANAQVDQSLF
jgi:hypothetical protein